MATHLERGSPRCPAAFCLHSVSGPAYTRFLAHRQGGVDLERVRYRLGHGDLTTTTRYVKILDEEDSTAADAIAAILGDVA